MSNVNGTCDLVVSSDGQDSDNDDVTSITPDEEVAASYAAETDAEREPSPEPIENNHSVPTTHISSPYSLEIVSPRPSPHMPTKNFMSASVEDCFDDDDSQAPHDSADTPPSSYCVTTPPIDEALRSPSGLDKEVEPVKPEIHIPEDNSDSPPGQVSSPHACAPLNTYSDTSRRRPSVMDYLVSQDPSKNSVPVSEASGAASGGNADVYAWSDHDLIAGQEKPNGRPGSFGDYHGDDKKPQLGWNGQQPAFRLTDNALNIQGGEFGMDAAHRRPYAQPYDHNPPPPAPRSNASVPHSDHRPENPPGTFYPEFPTRLESMAPSGYQLLAAKLSGDAGGQPLTPIYRRFDALNHRLLLYMQDEIADLERQLTTLEAKDTVKRSYAGGVIPASRRQDRWISGSLADQKTEVLGHIGYKLSQYNQVLASFRTVQDIPVPTWRDIQTYKTYLSTGKLIVDDETRFLDVSNDLVSLAASSQPVDDFHTIGDGPTPMPRAMEEQQFPPFFKDNGSTYSARAEQATTQRPSDGVFLRLALSGMCAVFVPIVTFAVVPNFVPRMAIVLLIALSVGIMVEQAGLLPEMERNKLDWILYCSIYCGAMAVIAGAVK